MPQRADRGGRTWPPTGKRWVLQHWLILPVPTLAIVGSRAFLIAGAKVWKNLPDDVTSALSLSTFRRHLKT